MTPLLCRRFTIPVGFLRVIATVAGLLVTVSPVCALLGSVGNTSNDPLKTMVSTASTTPAYRGLVGGKKREKTGSAARRTTNQHVTASSDVNMMDAIRNVLANRSATGESVPAIADSNRQQAIQSLIKSHPAGDTMQIGFSSDSETPRFIKFDRSAKSKFQRTGTLSDSRKTARQFFRTNRTLFGLASPDDEMIIKRQWTDAQGNTHFRFQQTVNDIPVWGRGAMVHLDKTDEIYLFQGRYETSPGPGAVAVTPGISVDDAMEAVSRHLDATFDLNAPPELVVHADENGTMALAYEVDIIISLAERWIYFVDALTGQVRHHISGIMNQLVSSSGTDTNGTIRTFNAWSESEKDYLMDPSIPLADPPYQPIPQIKNLGNTYILTADNGNGDDLYYLTRPSGGSWDPAGVSAAFSVRTVYDYYKDTHGRNGIDDQYLNYLVVVHFGQNEANAFWNGKFVVLGDGDGQTFSSLAGSLDVIAHEIQHGVTHFTAGLIYENQSGALNEAYSDIFACMVDRDDWTVGEDVTVASPGYLRNLANPELGLRALPTKMSEYRNLPNTEAGDWGGVHTNMSIPSRAAYLMADGLTKEGIGSSIGRDKTETIFYRALTTYLQSSSGFQDARVATVQAAEDLYGAGSTAVSAVKAAWDAVEVGDGGTPDETSPTPVDPVTGEDMMVYLYPTDDSHTPWTSGETYHLYSQSISSPFSGYDATLDRKLHDGNVAYTRPAVFTDEFGSLVFFIDTDYDLWAVNADGTGNAEQITTSGNISSFSISPDGLSIAFTTPSADDNHIYVGALDSNAVSKYELEPFSDLPPGENGTINTILYADALDFDYSSKQIVFDALNCISIPDDPCNSTGGGYRYWSIGFLDLTDGTFSFPFPNQNPAYDVGFPKFATNNNYVIALDVIDYSEYQSTGAIYSSVWTMNWKEQISNQIADPNKGTDDFPIWGTPSFWGDDNFITIQVVDDSGGTAFRVPIDADWQGSEENSQRLNGFDVAMPVMHRAGVRSLDGTLSPSALSLSFDNIISGQTTTRDLVLSNTGNRDIRISNIAISGSMAFSHNGINSLLPRGKSMTIRVTYSPAGSTGGDTAILSVTSDADTPRINIPLTVSHSVGQWSLFSTGTNKLGIRALIHTEDKGAIPGAWKEGGEVNLSVGKLIWGYFYADPSDVNWGSPENPEMFVKILVGHGEQWVNINYFHVSVPDIEVFTDYPFDGMPDGHDKATGPNTTSMRFVEHTFINGVLDNKPTVQYENGQPASGYLLIGQPTGYSIAEGIRIGAMINAVSETDFTNIVPTEGLWKKGGESDIGMGSIIWGYFYANLSDVSWGGPNNPEMFVKLLVGDDWLIANYFHVSAPDIEAYGDYGGDHIWENGGTANLGNRFIEYRY